MISLTLYLQHTGTVEEFTSLGGSSCACLNPELSTDTRGTTTHQERSPARASKS